MSVRGKGAAVLTLIRGDSVDVTICKDLLELVLRALGNGEIGDGFHGTPAHHAAITKVASTARQILDEIEKLEDEP